MNGNFIDGQWVGSASGRTRERWNPADGRELISTFPDSDAKDAADAIGAVASGYREWAERSPEARADVLNRAADILAAGVDDLARELVREEGKTLTEALVETRRTPANFRFYASEAVRLGGQTFATADHNLVFTAREPVGVVVAITPWNFPLNIPSRKLGPALAAGNGVVFKPSEITPLLGRRLVEALLAAGLPAGAIALLHGGAEVGAALVSDRRVGAVTFTGSTAVGTAIHRALHPSRRSQLEMGGKNPVVVLADADLDRAADIVARGAFGLSGQACTGTSRLIVQDSVHDDLVERVVALAQAKRLGNGLAQGVDCGPLATQAQFVKVHDHIESAKAAGAQMRAGDASLPSDLEHGQFVRPTVFTDVEPSSRLAQEEVFGPVLAVLRVGSFDEAIDVANDNEYGLCAGIVTRDIASALTFAQRIQSGVVKINQPTTGVAANAPFGGIKNSSTQTFKEQAGDTMMHFYTVDKTVYLSA
jgi:alpha-ketoglutaric semialdehyde dehydrogenase